MTDSDHPAVRQTIKKFNDHQRIVTGGLLAPVTGVLVGVLVFRSKAMVRTKSFPLRVMLSIMGYGVGVIGG